MCSKYVNPSTVGTIYGSKKLIVLSKIINYIISKVSWSFICFWSGKLVDSKNILDWLSELNYTSSSLNVEVIIEMI